MTVGTRTIVGSGSSASTLTSYTTASMTPTANRFRVALVLSRRTDGTAAAPTEITGFNATWEKLDQQVSVNGNFVWSIWRGQTAGVDPLNSGALTINHAAAQQGCAWSVLEVAGVEAGATALVQPIKSGTSTVAQTMTLNAPTAAGNAILVAFAKNVGTGETYTTSAGFEVIGNYFPTGFAGELMWGIDADGGQAVTITPVGTPSTAIKAMFAFEIADAPAVNAAPTVTISQSVNAPKPGDTVVLTATGADTDGTIASYAWTHDAPAGTVVVSGNTATLTVPTNITSATYTFNCTVTDNVGATGSGSRAVSVTTSTSVGARTIIGSGSINATQTDYVTPSMSPTASRFRTVLVMSRRTDGTAIAPTALSGMGLTWTMLDSITGASGNSVWSVWRGRLATGATLAAGPLTISYGTAAQQGCAWLALEVAGVDAGDAAIVGAIKKATGTQAQTTTLDAPTGPGNAILVAFAKNSTSETYAFSGDTTVIGSVAPTGFSGELVWAIDTTGGQAVTVTPSGATTTAIKALFSMEIADAPVVSNAPPTVTLTTNRPNPKPGDEVVLTASGLDSDGTISSYSWVHNAGGSTGTIGGNGLPVPGTGCMLGLYTTAYTTAAGVQKSVFDGYNDMEILAGRKYATIKTYYDFGDTGVIPAHLAKANQGEMIHISLNPWMNSAGAAVPAGLPVPKAPNAEGVWVGQGISTAGGAAVRHWKLADIRDGKCDAYLRTLAASLKTIPRKFLFDFMHEPENRGSRKQIYCFSANYMEAGITAAAQKLILKEYADAYRHIIDLFKAEGVTNAVYSVVYASLGSGPPLALYRGLYPGDDYIEVVGCDPYNSGPPNDTGWTEPADVLNGPYNLLTGGLLDTGTNYPGTGAKNKPYLIGETGCWEDTAFSATNPHLRRVQWFGKLVAALKERPQIVNVQYFSASGPLGDDIIHTPDDTVCRQAFIDYSNDPYMAVMPNDQQAASGPVTISADGKTATFKVPNTTAETHYTFTVTVTDNSGVSASSSLTIVVSADTDWILTAAGWKALKYVAPPPPGAVQTELSVIEGDGEAVLNWTITPNGNPVNGSYQGRNGVSSTGGGPFESTLTPGFTGSRTFANLVNGTTYTLYVAPVVGGVRKPNVSITATPVATPGGPVVVGPKPPPGWVLMKDVNLTVEDPDWTYQTGKTNNAGYNTPSAVTYTPQGQVITAKKRATPIVASGYSLLYDCGEAMGRGPSMILPNYFRCRAVWICNKFHSGLWPAIWFRPFGPGEGEVDWHEAFGGRVATLAPQKVHGSNMIKTPYGANQVNYSVTTDYTKIGDDRVLGITNEHVYECEKGPGYFKTWIDGTLMTEHTRVNTKQTTAEWDGCFEVPTQKWYFRHTYQIGNDPDGKPANVAGVVPDTFVSATSTLKSLQFYIPA